MPVLPTSPAAGAAMRRLPLILATTLLGACGQTGPLYLPDEGIETPVEVRGPPAAAPAATPGTGTAPAPADSPAQSPAAAPDEPDDEAEPPSA